MTPTTNKDYTKMNLAAKQYGLKGKNGKYTHKLGFDVDLSATNPDVLSIGYTVARLMEKQLENYNPLVKTFSWDLV